MPHAASIAFVIAWLAMGCQPVTVSTPRYPAMTRTRAGEAKTKLTFVPASGITRLVLPCTTAEPDIDNGLDDDCDGRVDRQTEPTRASLFIALAHNTQVDVELALVSVGDDPKGEASLSKNVSARVQVCERAQPFAIQQAAFPALAKGRYEVAVVHGKVCGAELPASIDASLWLEGKAQGVYAVNVAPNGRTVLGTVEVQ